MIAAKMASMRECTWDGCQQVISIGDSDFERWALHDLQFADESLADTLYKTIQFPVDLSARDLREILVTAEKILHRFSQTNVAIDINLRLGDTEFLSDLKFAMHTGKPASRNPVEFLEYHSAYF
jgi:hypothetical protein